MLLNRASNCVQQTYSHIYISNIEFFSTGCFEQRQTSMSGPEFRMTPHGGPFDITICDLSVCVCVLFFLGGLK